MSRVANPDQFGRIQIRPIDVYDIVLNNKTIENLIFNKSDIFFTNIPVAV